MAEDKIRAESAELALIGSILQHPGEAGEVFAVLDAADFKVEAYGAVFGAMLKLHERGAPVEPLTLEHELGEDYRLILRQALIVEPVDIGYYAEMIRETSRLADIQAAALNVAYAEAYSAAEEQMDALNKLFVARRSTKVISAAEAAQEFCDRAGGEKPHYLEFGFKRLDGLLTIELGDMMIIGGYPSSGKTMLSLQIAAKLAEEHRVGYFSLETSPAKLTDRLMSHMSAVPLAKIKQRDLGDVEWLALSRAAERLHGKHLDLIDAGGMTVRDIRAVSLSRKHEIIIIDYLQLIAGNGRQSRYEQVTQISQELHTLGRANGITVIALAQLKRPDREKGKPIPPSMADFRESGQIEQDADCAILLYPTDPADYRSDRVLYLAKNKEGTRDRYNLEFDGAVQTLRERPKGYGDTQREIRRAAKAARAERDAADYGRTILEELPVKPGEELPF